ncbi:MAG: hypothetical protein GTN89_13255 [Acidobacteria bacterium]|nr:hypothetical protein [Acidobacteriota bacterium]NIM60214.1 hypothetical protein [Acidobacteriota bacterium]NIO60252.1 hypothetical protein [Acidobacteriota bacterium]NIQ31307.1 hypothetical protein [Acidobacteriota bacterium]NIQ86530.1 hypothetical protein [Acidobacteriota bacterium]
MFSRKRWTTTVLAAAVLVGSAACRSSDPTNQVTFFDLAYMDFTAAQPLVVGAPGTFVFRDQTSWDAFWQAHAQPPSAAPMVDFNEDMLIGVFWGAWGTGCFDFVQAIERVRVRIDGVNTLGVIEVDIGLLPNLGSCATPVNPFQVIILEATATAVEFVGQVPT